MISTPLQKSVPEARWLSGPEVWPVYNSCDIFCYSEVVVRIEMRNGIAGGKISVCVYHLWPDFPPLVLPVRLQLMVDWEPWSEMVAVAEILQELEV